MYTLFPPNAPTPRDLETNRSDPEGACAIAHGQVEEEFEAGGAGRRTLNWLLIYFLEDAEISTRRPVLLFIFSPPLRKSVNA